jgi:predicted nucleic acid-binding protein
LSWLLDTNVLSELRKGDRADLRVKKWVIRERYQQQWVSVLSLGEIRKGIELLRRKDPDQAKHLDTWLNQLSTEYADRILPVCSRVADLWGQLQSTRTLPVIDSLLVATATVHHLRIATRNISDFEGLGIEVVDPFG